MSQVILEIGCSQYLMPTDKAAVAVISAMRGAVEVRYHHIGDDGERIWRLEEEPEVTIKPVTRKYRFVTREGEAVELEKATQGKSRGSVIIPRPRRAELREPKILRLEGGR